MALSGYSRASGNRRGGIRSIALARAVDVRSVEYDAGGGVVNAITLAPGSAPVPYRFEEDRAYYAEEMTCRDAACLVAHTLYMDLGAIDSGSRRAVEQLAAGGAGVVAVVTMNSGVSILVGHSARFGAQYPLRLTRSAGNTGAAPADNAVEGLLLGCTDTAKAAVIGPGVVL